MGMGNRSQDQVYFDRNGGGYYTYAGPYDIISNRNYFSSRTPQRTQQQASPISNLVSQAMSAKANPVSLAQLFPSMNAPTMGTPMTNYGGLLSQASPFGQGSFGAGRFLGGNAMGNTGMTSNAMNTM